MLPQCLFPRLKTRRQAIILRLQPAAAGHRRHRLASPKGALPAGGKPQHCEISLHHHAQYSVVLRQLSFLPANMRKMSTEKSRRAQHKQDKQTTLCPETNLLRSRGERSRLGRKLSTTAPEHCYSCLGALLQRLRKVAPKPPEKAYSPLRKNSKLRKAMTAKLSRGCCKAVTRLLQSCYVCRATCPTKATNQQDKEKKAAGRSLPQLGKKLQSD